MAIKKCVVCEAEFKARTCGKMCSDKCRSEREREQHVEISKRCWLRNKDKYQEPRKRRYAANRESIREKARQKNMEISEKEKRVHKYRSHPDPEGRKQRSLESASRRRAMARAYETMIKELETKGMGALL